MVIKLVYDKLMVKNYKWLLWWRGVWMVIIDKDLEFRWFILVKKIIINYIKDLYWFIVLVILIFICYIVFLWSIIFFL